MWKRGKITEERLKCYNGRTVTVERCFFFFFFLRFNKRVIGGYCWWGFFWTLTSTFQPGCCLSMSSVHSLKYRGVKVKLAGRKPWRWGCFTSHWGVAGLKATLSSFFLCSSDWSTSFVWQLKLWEVANAWMIRDVHVCHAVKHFL